MATVELARSRQSVALSGFTTEPLRIGDGLGDADADDRLVVAPFPTLDARLAPAAAARAAEHLFAIAALGFLAELRAAAGIPETAEFGACHVVPRQRDLTVEDDEFRAWRAGGEFVAERKPRLADRGDIFDTVARVAVRRARALWRFA